MQLCEARVECTNARLTAGVNIVIETPFYCPAMREGIYTAGYLGVGPSVREFLVATYKYSENAARVPAAILGGAFACLLSQCVCIRRSPSCEYYTLQP